MWNEWKKNSRRRLNRAGGASDGIGKHGKKAFEMDMPTPKLDYSGARDNIVFRLINTEQNKEMLAGMPHREYQDLSIINRWVVGMDEMGIQSTMIKMILQGS